MIIYLVLKFVIRSLFNGCFIDFDLSKINEFLRPRSRIILLVLRPNGIQYFFLIIPWLHH